MISDTTLCSNQLHADQASASSLETDFNRKNATDLPADADTFYYNPAFVAEWAMPPDLWIRLPTSLTTELSDWQAAGAAVCTVLARIDKLDVESLYRGWPSKNSTHLSRTTSDCSALDSPRSTHNDSPPFHTFSAMSVPPSDSDECLKHDLICSPVSDTPSFTPRDSIMGDEVDITGLSDKICLENIDDVLATESHQASEPTLPTDTSSSFMTSGSQHDTDESVGSAQSHFDESAWDVFIRSYEAELESLRIETFVRFRHIGKSVDRLWLDLKSDSTQPMLKAATVEFVAWWQKMNDKAQDYEKEVQMLEVPQLELVRLKRASRGLST